MIATAREISVLSVELGALPIRLLFPSLPPVLSDSDPWHSFTSTPLKPGFDFTLRVIPEDERFDLAPGTIHAGNVRILRQGARVHFWIPLPDSPEPWKLFSFDFETRRGEIAVRSDVLGQPVMDLLHPIDRLLFSHLLAGEDALLIHACSLSDDGRGLIFTGPSDAGKSTSGRLWTAAGAQVLNDEMTILRRIDGEWHVFGTPWFGGAGLFRNDSAPLDALFHIRHGSRNEIEPLAPAERFGQLLRRLLLPYWDPEAREKAMALAADLVQRVPAHRYSFVPDSTAVDAVRSFLHPVPSPADVLRRGGTLEFPAKGRSMEPTIRAGDILVVTPIDVQDLRIGDVVFCRTADGGLLAHRLSGFRDGALLLTPDAGGSTGELVPPDRLLGRVVSLRRRGRSLSVSSLRTLLFRRLLWHLRLALRPFHPRFHVRTGTSSETSVRTKFEEAGEIVASQADVDAGFDPQERARIDRHLSGARSVLCLGCGTGREVFAFARLGLRAKGVDISTGMIETAQRNAVHRKLPVEFAVAPASGVAEPDASFDAVWMERGVYSFTPTSAARIDMLARIRRILSPDGLLFFHAHQAPLPILSPYRLIDSWRRIRKGLLGIGDSEPGDRWMRNATRGSDETTWCYIHYFPSASHVAQELRSAGFDVVETDAPSRGTGVFSWVAKARIP